MEPECTPIHPNEFQATSYKKNHDLRGEPIIIQEPLMNIGFRSSRTVVPNTTTKVSMGLASNLYKNQAYNNTADSMISNILSKDTTTPSSLSNITINQKVYNLLETLNTTTLTADTMNNYKYITNIPIGGVAIIRINNFFKVIKCASIAEYEKIKIAHEDIYCNKKFDLEFNLTNTVTYSLITDELDDYNFIKNDDIEGDITLLVDNLIKLSDAKKFIRGETSRFKPSSYTPMPTPIFCPDQTLGVESRALSRPNASSGFDVPFSLGETSVSPVPVLNNKQFKSTPLIKPSYTTDQFLTPVETLPGFENHQCDYAYLDNATNDINYNIKVGSCCNLSDKYVSIIPTNSTILYNNVFMNGIVLSCCQLSQLNIKEYFKELSLVKTITFNKTIDEQLEELFRTELYESEKILATAVTNILSGTNSKPPSLNMIKKYFTDNYIISDNVENRIKFADILNEIINVLHIPPKFEDFTRRLLPLVLTELGLKKKRYTSGFHWYGLAINREICVNNPEACAELFAIRPHEQPVLPGEYNPDTVFT